MSLFVRRNVTAGAPAALVALALLTTGCAGQDTDSPPSGPSPGTTAPPHGYVEGAQEAAEQQSRLVLNDPVTGDTRVLDLITGEAHEAPPVKGAEKLSTDGRFAHFRTPGGTRVLDGGAWTVDHGDHVHYYRAAIRDVGRIPADAGARVRGDTAVTAVTGDDGRAVTYRRADLEKGSVGSARALPGTHAGTAVPYAEHLLTLTDDEKGVPVVTVHDRKGGRSAIPDAACEDPAGDAVTRRGVVFGCADGALLISEDDGRFTAERIPYDGEVPPGQRATSFRHRAGSDTLTAPAGDRAVWVLDVTGRTWTRVRTGPVVAANTAGEGSPLLVLETDGSLHGYDIATGEQSARTAPLLTGERPAGADGSAPVVEVDRSRAYVNDPDGRRVFEIDYNDGLRIARTFDLDMKPELMVETGR
ncbi:lipoprotein [Streptomyces malachitofuscus]|nr:lipoprotein [Streptomyces malachitofuscus]